MKRQIQSHRIAVALTRGVQLELRELIFLRYMAQHCVQTNMAGNLACERLDEILRDMGVQDLDFNGIDGLFE